MYEYYINTMFMLMQQPYMYYRFNETTCMYYIKLIAINSYLIFV